MVTPVNVTYQDRVQGLLRKIIYMHNLHAEETRIMHLFKIITSECLSYPVTERLPPFSWICTDGTPIQFSVSLGGGIVDYHELRYVTEICKPTMSLPERVKLTRKRIPLLLEIIEAQSLLPKIETILDAILPTSYLSPDYSKFGVWTGVQHRANNDVTLKFYLNLLWQTGDPWSLFFNALKTVDGQNGKMTEIRKLLKGSCYPNSMGIECCAHSVGRVKLYLRAYNLSLSETRDLLFKLNLREFETDLRLFHSTFLKKLEQYHPFSAIISIGIPRNEDETYDMKLEIGPTYYITDDMEMIKLIANLAQKLDIDITPYEQMMDLFSDGVFAQGMMHYNDIIGIGFHPESGTRLTTYLKPNLTSRRPIPHR